VYSRIFSLSTHGWGRDYAGRDYACPFPLFSALFRFSASGLCLSFSAFFRSFPLFRFRIMPVLFRFFPGFPSVFLPGFPGPCFLRAFPAFRADAARAGG
jgi:hypothetical protein